MTSTTSLPRPCDLHVPPPDATPAAAADPRAAAGIADVDGWQALALATHGRLLSDVELTAAELLPIAVALDLLFPTLGDAARHEAMCALDHGAG